MNENVFNQFQLAQQLEKYTKKTKQQTKQLRINFKQRLNN